MLLVWSLASYLLNDQCVQANLTLSGLLASRSGVYSIAPANNVNWPI